jgi:hypothetical protein
MGKSVKYPKPPDPVATAQAQGAINKETAIAQSQLNMVNQSTPYGSVAYQQIGQWADGTPRFSAQQTLSPDQAAILSKQSGLDKSLLDVGTSQLNRVGSALSQPLNFQGIPAAATGLPSSIARRQVQSGIGAAGAVDTSAPQYSAARKNVGDVGGVQQSVAAGQIGRMGPVDTDRATIANAGAVQRRIGADDFGDDRRRVEDALMQRMQPYLDQRREQERTRLTNMGFADPASQGYSRAMDEVYRSENDARMAAILSAGDEQSRLFGMDAAAGQFANAAQNQAFGQNTAQAQFANQNIDANFANQMAARGFNNQAQAQSFNQGLANASLYNTAQQQLYDQAAGRVDRGNANIDAALRNDIAAQQAVNAAQQQFFDQQSTRAAFANTAQAQDFGQNAAQTDARYRHAAYVNSLRDRGIQERMLLRQTPINEIGALMSGSQVTPPQFVNAPQTGIQPADYQGAVYANYQGAIDQANQRAAAGRGVTQGLFSLGGSALGAFGAINPFGW